MRTCSGSGRLRQPGMKFVGRSMVATIASSRDDDCAYTDRSPRSSPPAIPKAARPMIARVRFQIILLNSSSTQPPPSTASHSGGAASPLASQPSTAAFVQLAMRGMRACSESKWKAPLAIRRWRLCTSPSVKSTAITTQAITAG